MGAERHVEVNTERVRTGERAGGEREAAEGKTPGSDGEGRTALDILTVWCLACAAGLVGKCDRGESV